MQRPTSDIQILVEWSDESGGANGTGWQRATEILRLARMRREQRSSGEISGESVSAGGSGSRSQEVRSLMAEHENAPARKENNDGCTKIGPQEVRDLPALLNR